MLNAIGLSAKNLDCGMKHQKSSSSEEGGLSEANPCCQNSFELVHNDGDQQLKVLQLDSAQLIFVAAFTQSFIFGIELTSTEAYINPFISPPSIEKNYTVLFPDLILPGNRSSDLFFPSSFQLPGLFILVSPFTRIKSCLTQLSSIFLRINSLPYSY